MANGYRSVRLEDSDDAIATHFGAEVGNQFNRYVLCVPQGFFSAFKLLEQFVAADLLRKALNRFTHKDLLGLALFGKEKGGFSSSTRVLVVSDTGIDSRRDSPGFEEGVAGAFGVDSAPNTPAAVAMRIAKISKRITCIGWIS
jgi:hypothetical protein